MTASAPKSPRPRAPTAATGSAQLPADVWHRVVLRVARSAVELAFGTPEVVLRREISVEEGPRFRLLVRGASARMTELSTPAFRAERCGRLEPSIRAACGSALEGLAVSIAAQGDRRWPRDGSDDPPASGLVFVLRDDGTCDGPGKCTDNALHGLGPLLNDQLRQGLLGGDFLVLIEIAGVDEPFDGSDERVTLKSYLASDADDSFFPANNFQVPPGELTCCEFEIDPRSLDPLTMNATGRIPARIENYRVTTSAVSSFVFPTAFFSFTHHVGPGLDPPAASYARAHVMFDLTPELRLLTGGRFGGAVPIAGFALRENPFCVIHHPLCPRLGATWLEYISLFASPDIDLDFPPNGVDRVGLDSEGRVTCHQACGLGCESTVPHSGSRPPEICTFTLRDGFSIAYLFEGVRATVAGVSW